jgi:hypothetical protein
VLSLALAFVFFLYLARTWPGESAIRSLFITSIVVSSTLGWLPQIIVGLMCPVIDAAADRIAAGVTADVEARIHDLVTDQIQADRRRTAAEEALRSRLLGDGVASRAPVHTLRLADKRN